MLNVIIFFGQCYTRISIRLHTRAYVCMMTEYIDFHDTVQQPEKITLTKRQIKKFYDLCCFLMQNVCKFPSKIWLNNWNITSILWKGILVKLIQYHQFTITGAVDS
jgi:hypothetical protein